MVNHGYIHTYIYILIVEKQKPFKKMGLSENRVFLMDYRDLPIKTAILAIHNFQTNPNIEK